MKTRLTLILATAVVLAGLLWVALSASRTRVELRARLNDAREAHARFKIRVRDAEKALAKREAESATPISSAASPSAPVDTKPTSKPGPTAPGLLDLAHENPQLLNDFIASQKSEIQQRYVALFQRLNLTAAQRDAFKTIHAASFTRSADLGAAAHARGLAYEDPTVTKLREDSNKQTDAELIALLGEAAFAEYKDFSRTTMVRGFVDGFAVQLALSEPLKPTQAEQLARTLANASASYRKGGDAISGDLDWETVDREAQTYLSPAQFAAWQLGVAHNTYGGSRTDLQLKKIYDAAVVRSSGTPTND